MITQNCTRIPSRNYSCIGPKTCPRSFSSGRLGVYLFNSFSCVLVLYNGNGLQPNSDASNLVAMLYPRTREAQLEHSISIKREGAPQVASQSNTIRNQTTLKILMLRLLRLP